MIFLFFKTAFRNLSKRKGYTALNIFGLSLGLTSCLLIFNYVAYERSYDRFTGNIENLYRVQLEDYQSGQLSFKEASNFSALAPALKSDFPEVEEATRFFITHMVLCNEERNIRFNEDKVYYAEPAFLDLFKVQLISGDIKTSLLGPDKILISETLAKKYFGNTDATGKMLTWREAGRLVSFLVTGVFRDYPIYSHLRFNALASYNTFSRINGTLAAKDDPVETSWYWTDFYTYIKLKPGADFRKLQAALPAFADRHVNPLGDYIANHERSVFQMISVPDIHLYSHYSEEAEPAGDGKSVAFLFLTGFFILGIAWVNFINMATARSLERAREVGVRKLLGAVRRDLIFQFMMESFLVNTIALILAVSIAFLLIKPFNMLTGRPLGNLLNIPLSYILSFAGIFVTGSFISGLYPALVLSGFNPVTVLKGLFKNSSKGLWLRKGLIVGQFAISILLISGTIIIYRQVQFMRNKNLGVNINRTIVLHGALSVPDSIYKTSYPSFRNEVLALKGIMRITSSSNVMGQEILWSTNWKPLHAINHGAVTVFHMAIDNDFLPGFGIKLIAGRNFSNEFPLDDKSALINTSAARLMGWNNPDKALNETVISANGDTLKVVGVVADFHQEGLQKEITPLILFHSPRARNIYSIKVESGQTSETIVALKKLWDRYFPTDPFNYFYLDDFFSKQYDENKRFGNVFGIFSILAILIACFGLLALSAYNVLQRAKEIGIRKVLGASVRDLILLLSKDFLFLICIALIIAIPFSIWVMGHWLQSFAYRISLNGWIYVFAGIISLLIALITLSFQAIKAALANPVASLRSE